MKPRTKEELRKLVTETTLEVYEELTPRFVEILTETQNNQELTEAQKTDEILIDTIGYIKSCTNEILVEVLENILNLQEEEGCCHNHEHHDHSVKQEI